MTSEADSPANLAAIIREQREAIGALRARAEAAVTAVHGERQIFAIHWHEQWERAETAEARIAELEQQMQGLRARCEGLRTAGCMLANIAFNIAQGSAVDDRTRELLKTGQLEWDRALSEAPVRAPVRGEAP